MDQANEVVKEKVPIKLSEINIIPILLAFLLGFIIVATFFVLRKRSARRRDFLFTGLSESGKSAIYVQMMTNKFPETFVSIKENIGDYRSGRFSCRLVDIPGHYRVRDKYFDMYKQTARGVIFVVDASTAQKEIRDVADALYNLLIDGATVSCPFLVLCNKQDLSTAKSAQVIKSLLEKEMNIVRDTRSRKLQTVGNDDTSKPVVFGKEGRDFEFSHLAQNVQFYECSAKENQLSSLADWIDRML